MPLMPKPGDAAGRRRVFFAIWPDAAVAVVLDQLGRQTHALVGGRRMQRDTLHMTLAFIGDVPVERIEILRHAAGQVSGAAFGLHLDRLACWRRNHIVWAGCEQAPLPLLTLVGQLTDRLGEAGLPLEARSFAAHVTLLRDARCEEMPQSQSQTLLPEPLVWPVGEFVLAASGSADGNARYEIIGRWPLAAES